MRAGVLITDHDGTPTPWRQALQVIFEGLERTDATRAGSLRHYRLPIFMTPHATFEALSVRPA